MMATDLVSVLESAGVTCEDETIFMCPTGREDGQLYRYLTLKLPNFEPTLYRIHYTAAVLTLETLDSDGEVTSALELHQIKHDAEKSRLALLRKNERGYTTIGHIKLN